MHRRDIETIAKAIKAKIELGAHDNASHDYQVGHHEGITTTACAIAAHIKTQHPKFRVDLFYRACGLDPNG